jgi:type IV secretory pathway VirB10-like protein
MRLAVKYAACLLAVVPLLQGCDQKNKAVQTQPLAPPIVDAPPEKPATVSTADLPPPVIGDAKPATPPPDTTAAKPVEPPKKPVRHKKPAASPGTTGTEETAKATSPAAPSSVSAIGQLSGGASGDLRSQTQDTINTVEKGVNGITRSLSDSEKKTEAQIREFLKEAKQALESGDTDGAHTLANKAKVLLSELNPQS